MHQSPRTRRLRNDLVALERVRSESSIFRFTTQGDPPNYYSIVFKGRGLWRDRGKVKTIETHRLEIKLGSSYPRTIPELRWMTPVYHPNISEIGMVCLGGYGTHWVPSVQLDELCVMLWDMARYHNYDIRSPYNREAALWVANQTNFRFPTDERPLRDLRAALGRIDHEPHSEALDKDAANLGAPKKPVRGSHRRGGEPEPIDHLEVVRRLDQMRGSQRQGREPELTSRAERVRRFINQYGQIFAKGPAPPPREPSSTPAVNAAAHPDSAAQAAAPLDSGSPLAGEEAAPGELNLVLTPTDGPEPPAPRGGGEEDGPDDSILFEPFPSEPREPVAPRGGEEIVFID
jgi:ubiquitin-protein ligase